MRKRKLLLLILLTILLVAVLLRVLLRTSEPIHQGKPLSYWLHTWAYSPGLKEKEEAKQATLHIGTNAVPFLLQYIDYTAPRWKKTTTDAFRKLKNTPLVGRIIPGPMTLDDAAVRAETAVYVFDALGQTAAYAYTDLARLACNARKPEPSERAIRVLMLRRSGATNALGLVLSNAPTRIRLKTLLYVLGQHDLSLLRALQPALIHCLHDPDDDVVKWAAFNLTELKNAEPEAILAILIDALNSSNFKVRTDLIKCIATYDMAAAPAVPSVVPFLTDADPGVRKEATNFLRMIAPEILTNSNPIRVH